MDCDQALQLISAEIDQEIDLADRTMLDAHLAECAACRESALAFRNQDAALMRAFAPRRNAAAFLADRVVSQLQMTSRPVSARKWWLSMSLAAAAGFLLAVVLLRPWQAGSPSPSQQPVDMADNSRTEPATMPPAENVADERLPEEAPRDVAAQLAYASGAIELLRPDGGEWVRMQTDEAIPSGARVRTSATGRCEFRNSDGSLVRLNHRTELLFLTHRTLELANGQIWSQVEKSDIPFEVHVPRQLATVTALGTRFDVLSRDHETTLTVVEGSTRVAGEGWERVLEKGQKATFLQGTLGDTTPVHNLAVATSWVNEILKLKGPDNPEFTERMDDLLAQIGQGKMTYLPEKEILELGDHCVLPLTRYIQSDRSRNEPARRRDAARILGKIAQPWSVPELISLLGDDDGIVRAQAAKGLERLTDGETQGLVPTQWSRATPDLRDQTQKKWKSWWETNQGAFPAPPFLNQTPTGEP